MLLLVRIELIFCLAFAELLGRLANFLDGEMQHATEELSKGRKCKACKETTQCSVE